MVKGTVAGLLLLIFCAEAIADCEYQGRWYRTGSRVGDRVCQDDGSWR